MKKTIKQLKDSKNEALQLMQNLIENAEAEDRNLTADEQKAWDEAEETANSMGQRVERLARSMELSKSPVTPVTYETQNVGKSDKDLQRFSFTAAASAAYTGQMEGLVREMHQEATQENKSRLFRGVGIPSIVLESRASETLPGAAGNTKPTDVGSFVDQLQANSVLVQAGANFYSGISADRKFPIISSIQSSFVNEDGTDPATPLSSSGSIDAITLSPHKLISVVSMSAEMMTQNASAEAALQRNMAASITAAWEKALLQDAASTTNGPASIWASADALSGLSALGKAELFALEKNILAKNYNPSSGRFAYVMNPSALAKFKAEAGVNFVEAFADFRTQTVNTYPYYVSSNVAADDGTIVDACLFGDFSDVHLATFGGLDIISDRFTDAHKGLSRLVIVSLVDGKAARTTAGSTSLVSAEI